MGTTPKGPLGLSKLDALSAETGPSIEQYVEAASEYVLAAHHIDKHTKKAAQIRLSHVLGHALATALAGSDPPITNVHVGERQVAGALRVTNADLSESHPLDGLRLAVELKPVNLAVGRAIWNRFGDIRMFAVNLHLKFPFAVLGGLLTVPNIERDGGRDKSTLKVVNRAINRLVRVGGRRNEAEAPHLLEAVGLVVYDPRSSVMLPDVPAAGSGLRWEEFVGALSSSYEARFEEVQ